MSLTMVKFKLFFSHRGMKATQDWFKDNAEKTDHGDCKPIMDIFVNTTEVADLKIFQILATLANADVPIIVTTRTENKVEITFILYSRMG